MTGLSIRKAVMGDFEELKDLKEEFFLHEAARDRLMDRRWLKSGLPKMLAKNLMSKKAAYFVAEKDGRLIGYSGAEIEDTAPWCVSKKRAHLFNLYIKKSYRRKGIGTKLADKTMLWARSKGIRQFLIMTYWWNSQSKRFYKRIGFKDYVLMMAKPR